MVSMAKIKSNKISKNEKIGKILKEHPEIAEILLEHGFHCLGCPMSSMETLEQGCKAHGMSEKEITILLEKMNKKTFKN